MKHNLPRCLTQCLAQCFVRLLVLPVLLLTPLLAVGCASDRQIIGQANQFHQGLEPAVMKDSVMTGYLQRVGDRIIEAAQELDRQGYGPESHRKEGSKWMFSDMKFHFV